MELWEHAGLLVVSVTLHFLPVSNSYVLTGTNTGFQETFGSTCHGAVSNKNYYMKIKGLIFKLTSQVVCMNILVPVCSMQYILDRNH